MEVDIEASAAPLTLNANQPLNLHTFLDLPALGDFSKCRHDAVSRIYRVNKR